MAQPTNPMGAIVGIGGDIYIHDTSTQASGTIFSHIYITSDAVINVIEVGDITVSGSTATVANKASVKTTRKYTGTLPQGYLICAGEGKGIASTFCLTSGSAEGLVFKV